VTAALDRLWAGDDPYLRLAAAQAELGHRRDRAKERLAPGRLGHCRAGRAHGGAGGGGNLADLRSPALDSKTG